MRWCSALLAIVILTLTSFAAADGNADEASVTRRMLIVHAQHLRTNAEDWANYRGQTGWSARILAVQPLKEDQSSDSLARSIMVQIEHAWGDALADGVSEFAVLLLGDADIQGIPTFRFHQHDPDLTHRLDTHFASDHPYSSGSTSRDQPRFPLGRIPARTSDEATIALEKIKAYESARTPAPWQRRINCLAGEGHFGPLDALLEQLFTRMVDALVPDTFDLTMTYAKATSMFCPPIDQLTPTILNRLADDALLFVYVGHGAPTALDDFHWREKRLTTLRTTDLAQLEPSSAHRPIAVLVCCSTGWFDLPNGEHSLAEAMLFSPSGPVAVIAGSRPTHPYANAVLLESLTRHTTAHAAETLGALNHLVARDMLRAPTARDPIDLLTLPIAQTMQWASSLREHRSMHVRLYNLLGDPCLQLPPPAAEIRLSRQGDIIIGELADMPTGQARITVQSARLAPPRAASLQAVTDSDDLQLPAKSANNYPIANDRTIAVFTAPIEDGRFAAHVPAMLDARAVVITVQAQGETSVGEPTYAVASLPIAPPAKP